MKRRDMLKGGLVAGLMGGLGRIKGSTGVRAGEGQQAGAGAES